MPFFVRSIPRSTMTFALRGSAGPDDRIELSSVLLRLLGVHRLQRCIDYRNFRDFVSFGDSVCFRDRTELSSVLLRLQGFRLLRGAASVSGIPLASRNASALGLRRDGPSMTLEPGVLSDFTEDLRRNRGDAIVCDIHPTVYSDRPVFCFIRVCVGFKNFDWLGLQRSGSPRVLERVKRLVRIMHLRKQLSIWFLCSLLNVECLTPSNFQDFYTETMLGQNRSNKYILDTLWTAAERMDNKTITSDLSQCVKDLLVYKEAVFSERQPWSIQMLDASSSVQPGFLTGNIVDLGAFDECIKVNTYRFSGQYCIVSYHAESHPLTPHKSLQDLSIKLSLCVPSTCSNENIYDLLVTVNADLNKNIVLEVPREYCQTDVRRNMGITDWITIFIFAAIMIICILSTIYDVCNPVFEGINPGNKHRFLTAFSIPLNYKVLVNVGPPTPVDILQPLRFYTIMWVISNDRFSQLYSKPAMNLFDFNEAVQTWWRMPVVNGYLCVETLLCTNGILITYTLTEKIEKLKNFNILVFYVSRFLRSAPPLALLLLFYCTCMDLICKGPLCPEFYEALIKPCVKNWWSTITYTANYATPQEMCMAQSWFLSTDMQLFWLSPIILYPMLKWPWCAKYELPIIILSVMTVAVVSPLLRHFPASYYIEGSAVDDEVFIYNYIRTHLRAGSWLTGAGLGIVLNNCRKKPPKLPKFVVALGWTLSVFAFLLVTFGIIPFQAEGNAIPQIYHTLYKSLSRYVWALALSWVIFACVVGCGGPVNTFLRASIWQPAGRLLYCIFITHVIVIHLQANYQRTPINFSDITRIWVAFGDMSTCVLLALLYHLFVEAPVGNIERILIEPFEEVKEETDDLSKDEIPTYMKPKKRMSIVSTL